MQNREVDVAIIGAGTAGMTAYRAALEWTDSVVVIESGAYGTTCARVGCMPSKLLIAAADVSHQVDKAPVFGIDVMSKQVDGRRVMERVRTERDSFVHVVEEAVGNWPADHRLRGRAKFIAPRELQVDDHTRVLAGRVVLAVGSRPAVPSTWNELGDRLLVSDEVFEWPELPGSVVVVGTGAIGMELSQALARLGVRTHLVGVGNRFGPVSDPEVSKAIGQLLAEDLTLLSDAPVERVARTATGVAVTCRSGGQLQEIQADYLLAATGRRSNLDSLDLEAAGIAVDERGFPAYNDSTGQIGDTAVFIAGDASNAHPVLHEAADDGRIAGDNAGRFPEIRVHPRRAGLSIIFTDPKIIRAGRSYADLVECGCQFAIGSASFREQGRSRIMDSNRGLLRVYGEQGSGLFLGAEMVGPEGEHLAHLLAWSAQHRLTVQQMLDSPYYHPVVEEGLRTALRRLNRELHMGPVPVEGCLDCGPGA